MTLNRIRQTMALIFLLLALPAAGQEMRNTIALTADLTREKSRTTTGSSNQADNLLLDFEYARSLWNRFELTFAGNMQGVRQSSGGSSAIEMFRAYQFGGRFYFYDVGRAPWTPYIDGSLGEAWLSRSGAGSGADSTQRFYGYEFSLGAAFHLSPRADLRVSANYDRYLDWEKVGTERDTFTRVGIRLGGAYRF